MRIIALAVAAPLALAALLVLCQLAASQPATDTEEEWVQATDPDGSSQTVRYLLHDKTGKGLAALQNAWSFEVKPGKDGLVETFGRQAHRFQLASMGFTEVTQLSSTGGPITYANPPMTDSGGFTGTSSASGYHNPEQLQQSFHSLAAKYPGYAKLIDLTAEYKQPKTVGGRSLYALKVSDNVEKDEGEPNILLVSNHHARELVTPELALDQASRLLEGIHMNAQIKKLVQENQIYVLPTMNPDGLQKVWDQDTWRRTNGNNVDLNRNYPIGWDLDCGGSTDKSGETWRGDKPFSEVETRTMRAFQKCRNFAKVMDFHSYSEEVRTNYGSCAQLPQTIDDTFKKLSQGIAQGMKYEASRSCCMGGNIHYAYNRHGSLAYLVETAQAFQPDPDEMKQVLSQTWPGVQNFLEIPIPVSGLITDKATGKPVVGAEIRLPDIHFRMGEQHHAGARGHYHLWLPEGEHRIEVHHPDSKAVKALTVVAKGDGHVQNIQL